MIFKIIMVTLLSSVGFAEEAGKDWVLSEKSLVQSLKNSSHQIKAIELSNQQIQFNKNSLNQNYQWHWVTRLEQGESKEDGIASFIPVFSPTRTYSTALSKNFSGGLSLQAGLFTDQRSTQDNSIDQATRSGFQMELSVDLWKNLFGRVDRAQLANAELDAKKSKIEQKVNSHIVALQMRKLYWSLIANQEQIRVTEALLKTSQKQLKDARKRGRQYIADKAEVARYKAQLSSRESTLKSLEYQRELLVEQLKKEIPEISNRNIVLANVNIEERYKEVYKCADVIGAYKTTPWQYTQIDELLKIVDDNYKNKKIISNRYSDIDVSLTSTAQISGVDNGFDESFTEYTENGKTGYTVGLQVTVPLGSSDSKAKKNLVNADYSRYLVEKGKMQAEVRARHTQIVAMVKLLREAVKSLRANGDNLSISIKSSKKKFKQARISLNDLINEQDAFFNSRLNEINTKLQVIHTLLDYFQTFTDDPCNINQVGV